MSKLPVVFFLLCLGAQCRGSSIAKFASSETDLNEFVTELLYSLTDNLVGFYGNEISIPDYSGTYGNKWVGGRISTTGGLLGDLTTLQLDNVSVSVTSDSILCNVEARLKKLQLSFDRVEATIRSLQVGGSGRVVAQDNLFSVQARVTFEGDKCFTALDSLKVSALDDVDLIMSLENSPVNEELVRKFIKSTIKKQKNTLQSGIEEKLKELINDSLKFICDYLA